MRGFALAACVAGLWGQTPQDTFRSTVQPALERECQGCHGAQQALSKLDVRTRESLLQGGTRGPSLVPGEPARSLLMEAIEGKGALQMPPGGASKRLAPDVIAGFRKWIEGGAPWAEPQAKKWDYKEEDLWAFRPVPPRDRSRTIDDFIQARLRERGLAPAGRSDRRVLIRRASFDLTGLPPAPEEVEAFVADRSATAWPALIDRLLASPRYGERWGRRWLDVVRYADSGGYSNDFERPNAWRYRDYVIRAFNRDKPYDRFVREQIAGDELHPGDPEALIATGFLRAGPWEHTAMSVEAVTRQMFLDDVTHSTAAAFLGQTLGCARCHDHKFDPLPTRDYYRMQAVFASTEFVRPKLAFLRDENVAGLEGAAAQLREMLQRTRAKVSEYRALSVATAMKKHGVSRPEDLPKGEIDRIMADGEGITPEKYEELKLFQKHAQLYQESLDRFEPKAFAVASGPLDGQGDGGPALKYPRRADYKPAAVRILPGGNVQAPGEAVAPGVLSAVEKYGGYPAVPVPESVSGRRSALANWIADAKNPLTARVMANRIWQGHFCAGLAGDPNNFGKMGKKPTHPELLDWLAAYFVESGWSVKAVHRAILLSEAYQRSGDHPAMETVRAKDPEGALLAYFPPRRLEAEELRDSILAVSGELSPDAGGPGVFPQINEDVARQPQHRMGSLAPAYHASPLKRQRNRRTVYTFQQRSLIDPMVEVFNGPSLDLSCERRDSSTVPTQAFALLNGQFTHDMALAMAARLEREAKGEDARIERAFRLAYGRAPEPKERAMAKAHLARQTAHHRATAPPARPERRPIVHQITSELTGETFRFVQQEDPAPYQENLHPSEAAAETRALADLALVLLNSNEFVYVY